MAQTQKNWAAINRKYQKLRVENYERKQLMGGAKTHLSISCSKKDNSIINLKLASTQKH